MMNKRLFLLTLVTALLCQFAEAADTYTTKGDGTTYSIQTLAYISETSVIAYELEEGQWPEYELRNSITIAKGDKFVMDDCIKVHFNKDVKLTIEGEADFQCSEGAIFDALDENPRALIRIMSQTTTEMKNCEFYTIGMEVMGEGAVNLYNCYFEDHDGSVPAALYFIGNGTLCKIESCDFHNCSKAAIGSAANASRPLTISHCVFDKNSTENNNIPQINVTAANPMIIEGCQMTGNPDNTMVGGIGISNFYGFDADITIKDCYIEDNRYGIGLVGPAAKIRIENNILMNNRYETDPMKGGSGISFYDPYQQTEAIITKNHIEGGLWGVTVIGCKNVNMGRIDVAETDEHYNPGGNTFKNNGNDGVLYDLYNNSANTIYAQGNTWNVSEQTEEKIESVIFHKNDDPSLGEVIYWPAATITEIKQTETSKLPVDNYYDLQGRKLTTPRKGINIINGKKVVH